ncbi:MAG: ion channel [Paraclostridium sp.]
MNTKFDEDTFIDKVSKYNKEYKRDRYNYYEISYKFYRDISYKYKQNNLQSLYGEYYYLSKLMERKTLKGIDKFKSTILWIICGYGERPTYALISSIEIIFVFTILYMIFGLNCGSQLISYKEIFLEGRGINFVFNDFIKAFHFSIVTFTTVGYGDVTPIGYSVFLSGLEMFLGVTMVGLWTATLAKKISR